MECIIACRKDIKLLALHQNHNIAVDEVRGILYYMGGAHGEDYCIYGHKQELTNVMPPGVYVLTCALCHKDISVEGDDAEEYFHCKLCG